MGVQLRFGTAGATGGGWSSRPGQLQPSFEDTLAKPERCYQRRGPKTWRDPNRWDGLWSFGCRVGGGDLEGYSTNNGLAYADGYEPFSCDGAGNASLKFVKGVCVDSSDAPLSGVNVRAYRASDHAYGGYEVQSREDGSYDCPTQFGVVAHYVTAYLAGSPDRTGSTVNTLTPANIDGSV